MTTFRWNADEGVWEFDGFGQWNVLRRGPQNNTAPMSFGEGFRHIVLTKVTRPVADARLDRELGAELFDRINLLAVAFHSTGSGTPTAEGGK